MIRSLDTSYGQIAYEGYGEFTRFQTFDGRPMPAWRDLPERTQNAWQAAVVAVLRVMDEDQE